MPTLQGTYVADSIWVQTSFDTGMDCTTLASLRVVLRSDSTLGGRLVVPSECSPDGVPSVDDSLYGSWQGTATGFRVYGPWGSLLTRADFDLREDTARTHITVRWFPLDPFSYDIRLPKQQIAVP